jgi:ATP-dependent DNA helicase RecG
MMPVDLAQLLATLRSLGTDTSGVEAKRATGGFPENLITTMCAFANRPGGGIILLGVDEDADFRSALTDAPRYSRRIADLGRELLDPPPAIDVDIQLIEGHDVVIAVVNELPTGSKPCRVRNGRQQGVWIRAFDGDYLASHVDEQALYSTRVAPPTTLKFSTEQRSTISTANR